MGWIKSLGYLGVHATDLDAWRDLAELVGMQEAEGSDAPSTGDTLFLRMDERAWRVAVIPHHAPGVAYIGWELAEGRSVHELAAALERHGIMPSAPTREEARERRVAALLHCIDPAGNALEFFEGSELADTQFRSPRGVRFVTGDGGMGHVFAAVADLDRSVAFYEDLLGFRLSDTIALRSAAQPTRFYHTNPRHHSLALAAAPRVGGAVRHLMVEVDEPQWVIDAFDAMVATGMPLKTTLGKHTNDYMFSFYVQTPSGFDLEYGCKGRRIEDDATWTVGAYTAASLWGHRAYAVRPTAEEVTTSRSTRS